MSQTALDDAHKVKRLLHGALPRCGLPVQYTGDVSVCVDESMLRVTLSRPAPHAMLSPLLAEAAEFGPFVVQEQQRVETIIEARLSPKYPTETCAWRVVVPSLTKANSSTRAFHPSVLDEMIWHMSDSNSGLRLLSQHQQAMAVGGDADHHQQQRAANCLVSQALRYTLWWSRLALDEENTVTGAAIGSAWSSRDVHLHPHVGSSSSLRGASVPFGNAQQCRSHRSLHRSTSGTFLPDGRVVLWNLPEDHHIVSSATLRRRRHSCTNFEAPLNPPHVLRDTTGEHFVAPARRTNTVNELTAVASEVPTSSSRPIPLRTTSIPFVVGVSPASYKALLRREGVAALLRAKTRFFSGGPSTSLAVIIAVASDVVISPNSSIEALLANCALLESLPGAPNNDDFLHALKSIACLLEAYGSEKTTLSSTPSSPSCSGVGGEQKRLFTTEFIAPSLSVILSHMLVARRCRQESAYTVFWCGVVLVVILLPLLVTGRSALVLESHRQLRLQLAHDIANNLQQGWFAAVDHVRFIFELLDDRIRMCQARLVGDFLKAAVVGNVPRPLCSSGYTMHAPIVECSVCRQTLFGHPPQERRDGAAHDVTSCASSSSSATSGELIVQCVHCGHGGHLQHLLEWFASPLSQRLGCPAGCDCQCTY